MPKNNIMVDNAIEASYMSPNVFTKLDLKTLAFLRTKLKNWVNLITTRCPQSKERDRIIHQCDHALVVVQSNIKVHVN